MRRECNDRFGRDPRRQGLPVVDDLLAGTFTARSVFVLVQPGNYTSDATRSQGPTAGTAVASIGTTAVPQLSGGCPFVEGACGEVHEPGMLLMLVSGLLSLGLYARNS